MASAASLALAVVVLAAHAMPASAECVEFDEWPSFRELAPDAPRVVIGRVSSASSKDSAGNAIGFRLEVQEVPRGKAPDVIDFEGIRPPAPLVCRDSVLRVHIGDVIALAMSHASRHDVAAVAFVEGRPDRDLLPGVEIISRQDVRRLAADLPPTDTAATTRIPSRDGARAAGTAPTRLVPLLGHVAALLRQWVRTSVHLES